MPVFGCTTAYHTTHKRGPEEKYQLLTFLKSARTKNLWVARINRQNWQPTASSSVCLKHFLPTDFKHVPGDLDSSGNVRTKYRLKDGAIPSLYMKGAEPESNDQPPRKVLKVASEADIKFNHTYCKF